MITECARTRWKHCSHVELSLLDRDQILNLVKLAKRVTSLWVYQEKALFAMVLRWKILILGGTIRRIELRTLSAAGGGLGGSQLWQIINIRLACGHYNNIRYFISAPF